MLYFAYGSNMSLRRLQARTPSARFYHTAILQSHVLKFHKIGRDGSGKCDIVASDNDSLAVHGVLYELQDEEIQRLDRYEGRGAGYDRETVQVMTRQDCYESALTYVATRMDPKLKPFHWYKHHVYRGAVEHQLPIDYIERLARIESVDDPDLNRQARELSLYD